MPGAVESLLLLVLADSDGRAIGVSRRGPMTWAVAGCRLLELLAAGNVRIERDRAVVVNPTTSDPRIAGWIALLQRRTGRPGAASAVGAVARGAPRDDLEAMVESGGVVEQHTSRVWGLLARHRYRLVDPGAAEPVRERLRLAAMGAVEPDGATQGLLGVLDAAGLLGVLLSGEERRGAAARLRRVRRGEGLTPEAAQAVAFVVHGVEVLRRA